jgi:hypothetical protein
VSRTLARANLPEPIFNSGQLKAQVRRAGGGWSVDK